MGGAVTMRRDGARGRPEGGRTGGMIAARIELGTDLA